MHRNGVKLVVDECFQRLPDRRRAAIHTERPAGIQSRSDYPARVHRKCTPYPVVRFGWCMTADAALIEKLYHAGQPWNVSVIAQERAPRRQTRRTGPTETAKRIAEERRFLSDGLAACGLTVFPGEANFLLFRSNDTGLHEKLAEHGIMIRNCDNYRGLSAGYYRVAVKREKQRRAC